MRRAFTGLVLLGLLAGGIAAALEHAAVPPRLAAAYLERRAEGHASVGGQALRTLARWLDAQDRGAAGLPLLPALRVGAGLAPLAAAAPASAAVPAGSADELREAVARARPGDTITLVPGRYRFDGASIVAARPGTAGQPITVRAELPGTVQLEFAQEQAFVVSAPYWTFENLELRGVCREQNDCEHAFHVVGAAHHFVARNNRLTDFNAQFKINGEGAAMPDQGLIENNTLGNTAVRRTDRPVTPIDLVAASGWTIRRNLISDFAKGGGDQTSYGAFAKGGGRGNRFEGNIVLCDFKLGRPPGRRVGLSFGGGGSDKPACRDRQCITEHEEGVIESNLIAFCSDEGIYLNRAATSRLLHNTLIDTAGISVRFAESSAEMEGNLIDGLARSRDGGALHALDNLSTAATWLYLGRHPQRDLFRAADTLDFAWRAAPPRRAGSLAASTDLCGQARPPQPAYGAFEDFSPCILPAAPARP